MGRRKKLANGTGAAGYITSPAETMADYDIMLTKAEAQANSNIGLPITAMLGQMLSSGLQGYAKSGVDTGGVAPDTSTTVAANGSSNAMGQINAEGGEIVEAPGQNPQELKGARHEQGGVDLDVPEGTLIFSDRIKKEGKTMADRKKAREKKLTDIEKLLKNPDKAITNSAQRTKESVEKEEQEDLELQQLFDTFSNAHNFAVGTGPEGFNFLDLYRSMMPDGTNIGNAPVSTAVENPTGVPAATSYAPNPLEITEDTLPEYAPLTQKTLSEKGTPSMVKKNGFTPTAGDITGLVGNLVSTFGPMQNTLNNRAGDTPNVNAYKDFGKDALAANAKQMETIAGQKANNLNRIESKARGSKRALRNSARGINSLRAGDLAVGMQSNEADTQVNDQFAQQMYAILSQQSQLENVQDQAVMTGEAGKDLADRQDRDNFYTQKGQDIATMGTGLQQTGKDINDMLKNPMYMQLLQEMGKYFTIDSKGNLEAKTT